MSKEIRHFILTILIVTFVFAFDDKRATFELSYWLSNFFRVMLAVAVIVLVHYMGHKFAARHYNVIAEHRVWGIGRYSFVTKAYFKKIKSFPLGAVLAIIISFLSNGKFFFTAVESINLRVEEHKRLGRRWLKLTELETARIALAGPFANILFAFLIQLFNSSGMFDQLVLMNCVYAIYHMIPISQLDGTKVFFGSIILYVFGVVFIAMSFLLLQLLTVGTAFFIAVTVAAIATVIFFYVRIYLG